MNSKNLWCKLFHLTFERSPLIFAAACFAWQSRMAVNATPIGP